MVIRENIHTAEDLRELSHRPEYADLRLELSEGRLIVISPAGWKHGGIAMWLGHVIGDFVAENGLGMTTAAGTGYILRRNPNSRDSVRAPNVGFIAASRVPDNLDDLPDGFVPFAPDLAIEVASPNDDPKEVEQKCGVSQIWDAAGMGGLLGQTRSQGTCARPGTQDSEDWRYAAGLQAGGEGYFPLTFSRFAAGRWKSSS